MTATISFGHTSMYVINEFHKFLKRPLSQTILLLLERKSFLKELYHFHSITNCIEWNMATDEQAEDISKVLRCLDNFVSQFRLDSRAAALEMLMFSKTKKPQDVSTQTDFDINCRDVESKKTLEMKHPSDSFNPIQLVVHSDGQEPTPDMLNEIKSRSTGGESKSSNDCNICGKVFKWIAGSPAFPYWLSSVRL
uniref:Uncharacterized protein n=1 Tax=Ciona savignyi TaxID=51511 RepID=H2ZCV8_CIOSA